MLTFQAFLNKFELRHLMVGVTRIRSTCSGLLFVVSSFSQNDFDEIGRFLQYLWPDLRIVLFIEIDVLSSY